MRWSAILVAIAALTTLPSILSQHLKGRQDAQQRYAERDHGDHGDHAERTHTPAVAPSARPSAPTTVPSAAPSSVPTWSPTLPQDFSRFYVKKRGVDYTGSSISTLNGTVLQCKKACDSYSGCEGFSYDGRSCSLNGKYHRLQPSC